MRQIVCISTSNYFPIPTRKQNVMNRLSDAEILYIDPPVSWIAPIKDKKTRSRLTAWKGSGEKVRDNVTVYAPPPVLPFFNRYRGINRRNQKRLARFLNEKIREHGFDRPILWCYSPTSCDLVDLIPNSGVVYDCVDRHSAYQGQIDPAVVDKMEEDLARRSDQVFCTAQGLYDTLSGYNDSTVMIPNGAAYEIFSKAAEPAETGSAAPSEAERRPVFGFVGMLQECIDYDCICAVADAWPEGEVVMIGRSLPGVDLSPLEARKNIRLQGLVPQTELPDYIRSFDVCLNVFREGRLSRDVSPLKFYEYLATGKPIVSTGEPLQVQDFADVVYIAHNKEDFVEACRQALAEGDQSGPAADPPEREADGLETAKDCSETATDRPASEIQWESAASRCGQTKKEKRMSLGRACSWDERVKQMEEILKKKGLF